MTEKKRNLLDVLGSRAVNHSIQPIQSNGVDYQSKFVQLVIPPDTKTGVTAEPLPIVKAVHEPPFMLIKIPGIDSSGRLETPDSLPIRDSKSLKTDGEVKTSLAEGAASKPAGIQQPIEVIPVAVFKPLSIPVENGIIANTIANTVDDLSEDSPVDTEIQRIQKEQLEFIERVIRPLSPAYIIENGKLLPLAGSIVERGSDGSEYESMNLGGIDISGVRIAEVNNPIIGAGDASSVLCFNLGDGENTERIRMVMVGDGVGSTTCGDMAAKIITSYAQEYICHKVLEGGVTSTEQLPDLLVEAISQADIFFHSIPESTFRLAYEKFLNHFTNGNMMRISAGLGDFDYKATRAPLPSQDGNTQDISSIASTTLHSLVVIDSPNQSDDSISVILLPIGDGGVEVSAGVNFDGVILSDTAYSQKAPPQINYVKPVRTKIDYLAYMQVHSFKKPTGKNLCVTVHTDMLEKVKIAGRPRTPEDMLILAKELGTTDNLPQIMKTMFDNPGDDHTYIRIKC